jgi:hypothetical protein
VVCEIDIAPQQNLGPVGLQTAGVGSERGATLDLGIEGIEYSLTSKSSLICGQTEGTTKTYADGTYNGEVTLHGSDAEGQVGVFVAGEEI